MADKQVRIVVLSMLLFGVLAIPLVLSAGADDGKDKPHSPAVSDAESNTTVRSFDDGATTVRRGFGYGKEHSLGGESDRALRRDYDGLSRRSDSVGFGGFRGGLISSGQHSSFGRRHHLTGSMAEKGVATRHMKILWSKDKNELWGFSFTLGRWSVLPLEAMSEVTLKDQEFEPVIADRVALLDLGSTKAAYSSETGTWDVVTPQTSEDLKTEVVRSVATVSSADQIYTFAATLGRWTSPTDATLQEPTGTWTTAASPPGAFSEQSAGIRELQRGLNLSQQQAASLAERIRAGEGSTEELQQQLSSAVKRSFELRSSLQQQRLQHMKSRLLEVEQALQQRQENRRNLEQLAITRLLSGQESTQPPGLLSAKPVPENQPAARPASSRFRGGSADVPRETAISLTPFDWDSLSELSRQINGSLETLDRYRGDLRQLTNTADWEQLVRSWAESTEQQRLETVELMDRISRHINPTHRRSGGLLGGGGGNDRSVTGFGFGAGRGGLGNVAKASQGFQGSRHLSDPRSLAERAADQAWYDDARLYVLQACLKRWEELPALVRSRAKKAEPNLQRFDSERRIRTLELEQAQAVADHRRQKVDQAAKLAERGYLSTSELAELELKVIQAEVIQKKAKEYREQLDRFAASWPDVDSDELLQAIEDRQQMMEEMKQKTSEETDNSER